LLQLSNCGITFKLECDAIGVSIGDIFKHEGKSEKLIGVGIGDIFMHEGKHIAYIDEKLDGHV
jgi:hypothetical protein